MRHILRDLMTHNLNTRPPVNILFFVYVSVSLSLAIIIIILQNTYLLKYDINQ